MTSIGKFTCSARIPTEPEGFRTPIHHSPHKYDVRSEHYIRPKLTYAGFQRRGIRENFHRLSSLEQHVEQALIEVPPLSIDTPTGEHYPRGGILPGFAPGRGRQLAAHPNATLI